MGSDARDATVMAATAVVLAGGRSRRMGFDKATAQFNGTPLALHVARSIAPWFPELVISSNNSAPFEGSGFRVVPDRLDGMGVLGGLASGLSVAGFPWIFAVACDMPLIRRPLVEALWSLRDGFDAVVPTNRGMMEPLCAFYSVSCAGTIEAVASRGCRVRVLADVIRTRLADENDWLAADPDRSSFTNVNTPSELERARALAAASAGAPCE